MEAEAAVIPATNYLGWNLQGHLSVPLLAPPLPLSIRGDPPCYGPPPVCPLDIEQGRLKSKNRAPRSSPP